MRRFKNILCVIDPRGGETPLLERAVRLAERNGAALRAVAVVEQVSIGMGMPEGGPISGELQDTLVRESRERLERALSPFEERVSMQRDVRVGTTFLEIIHEVLRHGHDLVIKVAEDPEWLDRLFGGDDMHLLRKCPCPVWLLRPPVPSGFRRILATVDLDEDCPAEELLARQALNERVLQLGATQALADGAELHVGHALRPIDSPTLRGRLLGTLKAPLDHYARQLREHRQGRMDRLLQGVLAAMGPEQPGTTGHLVEGHPREAIPALARRLDADLVIMGTVARTGIPGFIVGNTAEMILSQLDRSVLALKPPGFTSPVVLGDSPA